MPSVQTTQTTEVKLSPALKKKLLLKLQEFAKYKIVIADAVEEQARLKADIEEAFVRAGEFNTLMAGVKIDGFNAKHCSPTRKYYDKLGAVKRGWMTTAQIAELTTEKPTKAGLRILCPGERDDDGE